LRTRFQQDGDKEAIEQAHAMLDEIQHLSLGDRERLFGYPRRHRQDDPRRAGRAAHRGVEDARLDGQKMSKSYNNTITCANPKSR
jgi:tryptophanyl-tRNA synthetase